MVGNDTIHTVTRKEHDCIGYMDVPKDVYWGIHTQRGSCRFGRGRLKGELHRLLRGVFLNRCCFWAKASNC